MAAQKVSELKRAAIVLATGLNGLGAIRSLTVAGFDPVVITNSEKELSALTRLHSKRFIVPDNSDWGENVLKVLEELSFENKPPILACSDKGANFVADNVDQLTSKYCLLIPSESVTKTLNDKKLEIDHMSQAGVPIPNSLSDISQGVESGKLVSLEYPVIIKPRTFEGYGVIQAKNIIVTNEREWDDFYSKYQPNLDKLVAQEVIPGGDDKLWVCNATFDKQSKLIAAFSFQRLGTMPSHFGVTSMAISIKNDRVIELCEKIGKALAYVGPAMFEFKFDKKSKEYLYIETNPRLGMCNWFDTRCGVNNVEATCLGAMNLPVNERTSQKAGLIFWNVMGDFIARLEDREGIRSILALYAKYFFAKKVWAIFLFSDPKPFLLSLKHHVFQLVMRVFRHIAKKLF